LHQCGRDEAVADVGFAELGFGRHAHRSDFLGWATQGEALSMAQLSRDVEPMPAVLNR
jgi:hypothetical protein